MVNDGDHRFAFRRTPVASEFWSTFNYLVAAASAYVVGAVTRWLWWRGVAFGVEGT
jgi:hypothetical protein